MLFRDVVSNISIGRQSKDVVSFYIKRLSKEQGSRVITAVLALLIVSFQAVTLIAPPKISEASAGSSNDIIYGGAWSKSALLKKYDSSAELRAIYARVNIGRAQIEAMTPSRVNSSWNVWSMGRTPHGEQNIRLDVPGAATPVYLRPLRVWGNNKWFSGLEGKTTLGKQFWILYDCGNPVFNADSPDQKPQPTTLPPTPPPPPNPTTPPPTPKIEYACNNLAAYPDAKNAQKNPPLKVTFVATGTVQNTTLQNYLYDFGDGETKTTTASQIEHTYTKAGTYTARVRIQTAAGTTAFSAACEQKVEVVNADIAYLKQAVNLSVTDSQGRPTQAANTTVQAGQEIRYTISARNTGTGVQENFIFEEQVGDILEYADITNIGDAKLVETPVPGQDRLIMRKLVWAPVEIAANKTVAKQFTVRVKSPIPTTPTAASDPTSFDLKMENIFFGNRIVINLPPPPVKQVETVSQSLPQTGSTFATTILAFFASGMIFVLLRNRLIRKELEIVAGQKGGQRD